MIEFKEFKKIVLDYFEKHTMIKKRYLKKSLKFEIDLFETILGNSYNAYFQFKEIPLKLNYFDDVWALTFNKDNSITQELCSIGKTIEKCCDYLWGLSGEINI